MHLVVLVEFRVKAVQMEDVVTVDQNHAVYWFVRPNARALEELFLDFRAVVLGEVFDQLSHRPYAVDFNLLPPDELPKRGVELNFH